jgi:outer membrane usher protein
VTARGTLMLAGGALYARNSTGSSYALVRAGDVEGIPVTLDNRFVGRTSKSGRLLVENIPAQATVKIDVDADQLPAEAVVREATHHIRVPRRAVAIVRIDAVTFRPVMRALVDPAGRPIAPGTPVRILPSDEMSLTGFDGLVELNAGAAPSQLVVGRPGQTCIVELAGQDIAADASVPLMCEPYTIAQGAPENGAKEAKAKRGRNPARVARRNFGAAADPAATLALSSP